MLVHLLELERFVLVPIPRSRKRPGRRRLSFFHTASFLVFRIELQHLRLASGVPIGFGLDLFDYHNSYSFRCHPFYSSLAYNADVVAFKMGRRQGGVGEASSLCSLRKKQSEDASPTSRNPPGRGQLAVFPPGDCRARPV